MPENSHDPLSESPSTASHDHSPSLTSTLTSNPNSSLSSQASTLSLHEGEDTLGVAATGHPSITDVHRQDSRPPKTRTPNPAGKVDRSASLLRIAGKNGSHSPKKSSSSTRLSYDVEKTPMHPPPTEISSITRTTRRSPHRRRGKGSRRSPERDSFTRNRPNDIEFIQKSYVVDQVLKCYQKEACKTFEDHKDFAMAELTVHAKSLCMTPTRLAEVACLLTRRLEEHLELDEDSELDDDLDTLDRIMGVENNEQSLLTPGPSRGSSTETYNTRPHRRRTSFQVEETSRPRTAFNSTLDNSPRRQRTSERSLSPHSSTPVPTTLYRQLSLPNRSDTAVNVSHPLSSRTLVGLSPGRQDSISPSRDHRTSSRLLYGSSLGLMPTNGCTFETNGFYQDTIPLDEVSDFTLFDTSGNSGVYSGTISRKTGKPHGYGRISYCSDHKDHTISYEGEWNQGQWNGQGSVARKNGDTYSGSFCDDQFHGHGEYIHYDSQRVFHGRFVMGHRIDGKMTYSDGSVYEGSWYCGKRHGKGTYRFSDGSIYKGEFFGDQMSGHGQLIWPDGSRFVGEFQKGRRHGKGKEYDERGGVRYEGLWTNNLPVDSR